MRELFRVIRRQTVVMWIVGVAGAVAGHYLFEQWWLGLIVSQVPRVGGDLLYAWHDYHHPPSDRETRVVPDPVTRQESTDD